MTAKAAGVAAVASGVAVAAVVTWLANRPAVTRCGPADVGPGGSRVIPASRVIARPWFGPHNVYAIFFVPTAYKSSRFRARVTALGAEEPAYLNEASDTIHGNRFAAGPGEFAIHTHMSTRFALWSLVAGRFGDLRQPCHWTLALSPRNRLPS